MKSTGKYKEHRTLIVSNLSRDVRVDGMYKMMSGGGGTTEVRRGQVAAELTEILESFTRLYWANERAV